MVYNNSLNFLTIKCVRTIQNINFIIIVANVSMHLYCYRHCSYYRYAGGQSKVCLRAKGIRASQFKGNTKERRTDTRSDQGEDHSLRGRETEGYASRHTGTDHGTVRQGYKLLIL